MKIITVPSQKEKILLQEINNVAEYIIAIKYKINGYNESEIWVLRQKRNKKWVFKGLNAHGYGVLGEYNTPKKAIKNAINKGGMDVYAFKDEKEFAKWILGG